MHLVLIMLHAQGGVRMRYACMRGPNGACAIDQAHTLLAPTCRATTSTSGRARAYTVFRANDCDHACIQIMQLAWSVEHTRMPVKMTVPVHSLSSERLRPCIQIMQLAWSVEHTRMPVKMTVPVHKPCRVQREAVLITSALVDHRHHPDGAFHATPHRAGGHA
jgi:hypothetical protein